MKTISKLNVELKFTFKLDLLIILNQRNKRKQKGKIDTGASDYVVENWQKTRIFISVMLGDFILP